MTNKFIRITEVEALLVQRWEINNDPNDAPYLIYADDGTCWGVAEHPPLDMPLPCYYIKQEGHPGEWMSLEQFSQDFEELRT